jgi:hypothetical protein
MLQKRDGRKRVYRRRKERFARNCVLEVNNFSGGSVMIWGAISYARKTLLGHIPGAVLTPHMLPAFFSTTTLGRSQLVLLLTF